MRRAITTLLTTGVIALPVADAAAAATKTKVVIRKFTGATYQVDRFGPLRVVRTAAVVPPTSARTPSRFSAARLCGPRA
jgi:hypothetical protein